MPSKFVQDQLDRLGVNNIEDCFNRSKARSGKAKTGKGKAKRIPCQVIPLDTGVAAIFQTKIHSVANKREHWAAKHRRAKEQRAAPAQIPTNKLPGLPCVVTMVRIAPRTLDGDNLQSGFKALRDGVADLLGVDDADPRVTWRYQQERGKAKQYAARVEITGMRNRVLTDWCRNTSCASANHPTKKHRGTG